MNFPITIAYDMIKKKPGCALLQAIYGGTIDNFSLQQFETDNWLLAPTTDLKLYTLKDQNELHMAIKITKNG